MENFSYQCATKIIFGRATEKKVGEETKKHAKKVLLHYGSGSIKKSGLYDTVVSSLLHSSVDFIELPGVVPNPRIELVRKGIDICRKEKVDFILAVGGGSVIDSAKAIACGSYHEGDAWDFFSKHLEVKKALPIGTVLTIPAAGSEASPNTVISNGNRKLAAGSNLLRPVFSILNPELTFSLPQNQTAAGIADMMAHIFERYFTNTKAVDLTDKLCEAILRSIIKNARIILKSPKDYDARAEIMWAGTLAHNGLLGTGREEDWGTHRIEHELSAFYDITHGAGLSIIFPAWMKYVSNHDTRRFSQFAENVWGLTGEGVGLQAIEATRAFFKEIGLPTTLKELKIGSDKFEEMADLATKHGPLGSFVKLDKKAVVEIYNLAK